MGTTNHHHHHTRGSTEATERDTFKFVYEINTVCQSATRAVNAEYNYMYVVYTEDNFTYVKDHANGRYMLFISDKDHKQHRITLQIDPLTNTSDNSYLEMKETQEG